MAADPGARAELGGAALDHFEACGSKFEVRKRDGSGDTVVEVTSEAAFPVAFNLRIQEALQYITAKTAIWRARLENEGNELHLELASPWRKSARTQFSPPISPASIEFCEHGWPLFGRYLSYVVQKTEGTHWNPVAYHLYNACEATASSVDAWAGGVSIAVEAVASLINVEAEGRAADVGPKRQIAGEKVHFPPDVWKHRKIACKRGNNVMPRIITRRRDSMHIKSGEPDKKPQGQHRI